MKTSSSYYRPDIDGLRAIAILAVFIYHVWPLALPQGYLGVDVFFVISGYLITSILLREHHSQRFSFLSFYVRRAIRLLPALCLLLVALCIGGYFWLMPDEYASLGHHIQGASLFISNFYLFNEVGYFDTESTKKILLHLWSLSIEEQFYLVWPGFIYLAFKFKQSQKRIEIISALFFLISLVFYIYLSQKNISEAFYMPHSRFWEIAAGSILAFHNKPLSLQTTRILNYIANCSLLVMIVLFRWGSPTVAQFVIPLLTLVLIYTSTSLVNFRILRIPALVFIGLISYPLYLWHWPVIVLNRLSISEPHGSTVSSYMFEIILSFALAILTYKYVELPLMKATLQSRIKLAGLLLFSLIGIGIVGHAMMTQRIQPRSSSPVFQEFSTANSDWAYPDKVNLILKPNKQVSEDDVPIILSGENSNETLFIGDSNMEQYYSRMLYLNQTDKKLNSSVFITGGGCIPIPGVINKQYLYCENVLKKALSYSKSKNVKAVVIGAQWFGYFFTQYSNYSLKETGQTISTEQPFLNDISNLLLDFLKQIGENKKIFIVLNIPIDVNFDPAYMIKRNFPMTAVHIEHQNFLRLDFEKKMKPVNTMLRSVADSVQAKVIDPLESLCSSTECSTLYDGHPIYKDFAHLRSSFVRDEIQYLDETLR